MKRKTKTMFKRTAACLLASFIILINFLPVAALAQGNFSPGTFSPGTFSPGTFSPGEFNPGTFSPGQFNPGTFSPGQFSPGQFTPGQFTPGDFSPGEFSPGEFDPGRFTPGTTTPGNGTVTDPFGNPGGQNGLPPQFNPPIIDLPGNVEHPIGNTGTMDPGNPEANKQVPFPYEDDGNYKAFKFITKDMLFPAIDGLYLHTIQDIDWNKYGDGLSRDLAKGIVKNRLDAMFKNESLLSVPVNLGVDIWSAYDNGKHISKFLGSTTDIRNAWNAARAASTTGGSFSTAANAGSFLSNATKTFEMGTGFAGKAAPWMAAISTGISGAETVMNFANGKTNDGIASLGETLMSGAVVLSATGVGAPVAAGVALVGGVLWAGAKIYKHAGAIKSAWKNRKKLVSDAAKSVSNAVKGGVDAVKSGFKAVSGWFS
jgi:hypothetical protein